MLFLCGLAGFSLGIFFCGGTELWFDTTAGSRIAMAMVAESKLGTARFGLKKYGQAETGPINGGVLPSFSHGSVQLERCCTCYKVLTPKTRDPQVSNLLDGALGLRRTCSCTNPGHHHWRLF